MSLALQMVCDGTDSLGYGHSYRPTGHQCVERARCRAQTLVSVPHALPQGAAQAAVGRGLETEERGHHVVQVRLPAHAAAIMAQGIQAGQFFILPYDCVLVCVHSFPVLNYL